MVHESEKFQFNVLLSFYLVVWISLMGTPYLMDEPDILGPIQMFMHPMFAPWVAVVALVYAGGWIARESGNDAWLLNKSFWAKQIFILIPFGTALVYVAAK